MENRIYLDNAATTKLDDEVLNAMLPYLTLQYGNPSSVHAFGRETRMAVEQARKVIAGLLGVKPPTIIFTSSATESNNTAIHAAVRDLGCDHVITSALEHHAVLHTIEYYVNEFGVPVSYARFRADGSIDENDVDSLLETKTKEGKRCFVSLMHANNETGQLTNLARVASLCKRYGAIFHSDCVQTIGHYPVNLLELGVHLASASAHKFHGPKGTGLLYVQEGLPVSPLIYGGSQEKGYRAGTENVTGIVGMAKALELSGQRFTHDEPYISDLKQHLTTYLKKYFPGILLNSGTHSLYSVLSVSFPKNERTEMLLMQLDEQGICASGGSACSSGGGSHVMKALGRAEQYITIRFSFSSYNTKEELDKVAEALKELLQPAELSLKSITTNNE